MFLKFYVASVCLILLSKVECIFGRDDFQEPPDQHVILGNTTLINIYSRKKFKYSDSIWACSGGGFKMATFKDRGKAKEFNKLYPTLRGKIEEALACHYFVNIVR